MNRSFLDARRFVRWAVVGLWATVAGCGQPIEPLAPTATPAFDLHTVATQSVARTRHWDGVVEAVHHATLTAQTQGRVIELPFDVNDYVEAGSIVVRFTDVEQQSGRQQADAMLRAAEASAAEAETEYRRISELVSRQLLPRAQLDAAIARRNGTMAQLDAAKATLRQAGEQVDYTVIRAPYAGILTERHVQVGESVRPGQPLVTGLSLDRLRVLVDVPQSDVAAIQESRRAAVLLDDGRRIEAERITVFPYANSTSHSFSVRVELPQTETGLRPGAMAKISFVLGQRERIAIPIGALVRRSEVQGVYIVDASQSVYLRQVRIGHRDGEWVEILAGLREGDVIAADAVLAMESTTRNREKSVD
jgi:RND family efflux transporter MFP subunit